MNDVHDTWEVSAMHDLNCYKCHIADMAARASVMTLPETLTGETGLICNANSPDQFRVKSMKEIYSASKRKVHITEGMNWQLATEWRNPRFNLLRSP